MSPSVEFCTVFVGERSQRRVEKSSELCFHIVDGEDRKKTEVKRQNQIQIGNKADIILR